MQQQQQQQPAAAVHANANATTALSSVRFTHADATKRKARNKQSLAMFMEMRSLSRSIHTSLERGWFFGRMIARSSASPAQVDDYCPECSCLDLEEVSNAAESPRVLLCHDCWFADALEFHRQLRSTHESMMRRITTGIVASEQNGDATARNGRASPQPFYLFSRVFTKKSLIGNGHVLHQSVARMYYTGLNGALSRANADAASAPGRTALNAYNSMFADALSTVLLADVDREIDTTLRWMDTGSVGTKSAPGLHRSKSVVLHRSSRCGKDNKLHGKKEKKARKHGKRALSKRSASAVNLPSRSSPEAATRRRAMSLDSALSLPLLLPQPPTTVAKAAAAGSDNARDRSFESSTNQRQPRWAVGPLRRHGNHSELARETIVRRARFWAVGERPESVGVCAGSP